MRAAFFGSPAFAVPCLDALCDVAEVACVYSQPDRPAGRGMKLTPPAVKVRALELGLPVEQPTKVRTAAFAESLRDLALDVAVVVAYGRILPRSVLEAPRLGCVNVHASVLPRWRGAAPIQWAIVAGDAVTGVTLMQMDEGMDTGPMLATMETPIAPDETAATLTERLSTLGATLLKRELPRYVAGALTPIGQDDALATKASLLTKEHGRMDFHKPAQAAHDHVRGMSPWPGAFTTHGDRRIKVHETHVVAPEGSLGRPGEILRADAGGIHVACGAGVIALDVIQEPGRKRLAAAQVVAGRSLPVGAVLGDAG